MGGHKFLETSQIVNGLALLISFYVGYKYALKRQKLKSKAEAGAGDAVPSTSKTEGLLYANSSSNYKMVLLVRTDLKMGKGKMAAQCGHAAVAAFQKAVCAIPTVVRSWDNTGSAKIALRVDSEAEMMTMKRLADAKGLNTVLIRDAGRTQIEPNSKTVLAIGPAPSEAIDQVTGHLRLL